MTNKELMDNARKRMAPQCRVCRECNGLACRGEIPGTGGKGSGISFIRNCERLSKVKVNMDLLYQNRGQDCSVELFGKTFAAPVFAAPISGLGSNYNGYLTEKTYAQALVPGCIRAGCAAFTGDGVQDCFLTDPLEEIRESGGVGVPTVKPWDRQTVFAKLDLVKESGAMAVAMDVDAAGLPILASSGKAVCSKSVEELSEIISYAERPFLVKGVMTAHGAIKAMQAGAYGVIVSNHGGRVMDHTPATIEVLPKIQAAVGGRMKILMDGGIRSGLDVFRALALGADAVLIGRPYVAAACGGGEEGVAFYTDKIAAELKDVMKMTGCTTLSDITADKVQIVE